MRNLFHLKFAAFISVIVIFIVDLFVPPGTTIGICYLISMSLVFNESKKSIIAFAATSTLLIVIDSIVSLYRYKELSGFNIYLDGILTSVGIWLSCFILMKHKFSEHKTIESERRFHHVLDNLHEGVQIINNKFEYIYVNNSLAVQSMFTKEELLGHTMMEKYPGIEKTELFKTLRYCMALRISKHIENEFTFPDGSKGFFELSIQPISEGIIILSSDISERKRSETAKSEQLIALEEMLFITSHKVRQPVAHILGLSNVLDQSVNSKEEITTIVDYMKQSALTLDKFVSELNDFIQASKGKAEK